jgi:hypothetical protein
MIILKEKKQPLNEIAQFKAAGIVVKVYSDDRGKFDSKEFPAHAHVFDTTGKQELGQIVLTDKRPYIPEEVQWYQTENPSVAMSKAIVQFANTINPVTKKLGQEYISLLWDDVIEQWFIFHEM